MAGKAGLKVRTRLDFEEVNWMRVLQALTDNFGLAFADASRAVTEFRSRLQKPLNLYWLRQKSLTFSDNRIMSIVGECHGADYVEIYLERNVSLLFSKLHYSQLIGFVPDFRARQGHCSGTVTARYDIGVFGKCLAIDSFVRLLSVQVFLIILSIIFYVLSAGMLLYAASVLILFIISPFEVAVAATNKGSIGLSLLCLLTGLAAAGSRACRNIYGLLGIDRLFKQGGLNYVWRFRNQRL